MILLKLIMEIFIIILILIIGLFALLLLNAMAQLFYRWCLQFPYYTIKYGSVKIGIEKSDWFE